MIHIILLTIFTPKCESNKSYEKIKLGYPKWILSSTNLSSDSLSNF